MADPADRTQPDPEPLEDLAVDLYEALRAHARRLVGGGRVVDATDLVHDAYLRLARTETYRSMRRNEFLALAATVIRRLLIDEVRRADRQRLEPTRVTMSEAQEFSPDGTLDLLALDAALTRLAALDPRQGRIVELRFFAGLTGDEVADLLGVSRRTVTKEWQVARAWLKRELAG